MDIVLQIGMLLLRDGIPATKQLLVLPVCQCVSLDVSCTCSVALHLGVQKKDVL